MAHPPFEDWLFADPAEDALTPAQEASLQEHLQRCDSCRALAGALQAMESQVRSRPMAAPAPGFTSRFQARLEADRQRLMRRQSMAVLGFSTLAMLLMLAMLSLLLFPSLQNPSLLLWSLVSRVLGLATYAQLVREGLGFLQQALGQVPLVWWVLFAGLASELAVIWIVSLRYLTNPRRVTK